MFFNIIIALKTSIASSWFGPKSDEEDKENDDKEVEPEEQQELNQQREAWPMIGFKRLCLTHMFCSWTLPSICDVCVNTGTF